MLKLQIIKFGNISILYNNFDAYVFFSISSVFNFCFVAKQRINSGYFLLEVDPKKKKGKKKNRTKLKKLRDFMESSDDDFV